MSMSVSSQSSDFDMLSMQDSPKAKQSAPQLSLKQTLSKFFNLQSKDSTSGTGMIPVGADKPVPMQLSSANSPTVSQDSDASCNSVTGGFSPSSSCTSPPAPTSAYQSSSGPRSVLLSISNTIPQRMQRANWLLEDFALIEKLYTGYASTVYKSICRRSGEVVVLKVYHLSSVCELYRYQIYREVRVHAGLRHENVVQLHASFQEGDKVVMVLEYADGNDLFSLLHKHGGRLSERLAVQMVLDPFLRVLHFLHSRAIMHRDIKPENILFSKNMCLKLADFGLAIDLREERAVTRAGTLDYMAPEVLKCPFKSKPEENKDRTDLHYSHTVDSWAVGVLTYELLVGFPPFYDQSRAATEERIRQSLPVFPTNMSEDAKSFILMSLQKSPVDRPTILDMLHHPWVESHRLRRSMRSMPVPLARTPVLAAGAAGHAPHLVDNSNQFVKVAGAPTSLSADGFAVAKSNGQPMQQIVPDIEDGTGTTGVSFLHPTLNSLNQHNWQTLATPHQQLMSRVGGK